MKESLNDEQLVESFVNGDEYSFDILCRRYFRLVKSLSRTFTLLGGSEEDLWQEGFLGLHSACKNYDKSKANGSSFMTFAYSCIRNKMLMAVRSEKTNGQIVLSTCISIENLQEEEDKIMSPEDVIIDNEYIREIKAKILSKLSNYERKVFELYLEGYNYIEIANKLSKKAKSIDNALRRIKEKCKE